MQHFLGKMGNTMISDSPDVGTVCIAELRRDPGKGIKDREFDSFMSQKKIFFKFLLGEINY